MWCLLIKPNPHHQHILRMSVSLYLPWEEGLVHSVGLHSMYFKKLLCESKRNVENEDGKSGKHGARQTQWEGEGGWVEFCIIVYVVYQYYHCPQWRAWALPCPMSSAQENWGKKIVSTLDSHSPLKVRCLRYYSCPTRTLRTNATM
jgi:hypothetical protein